jgi:hypothetical protein
MKKHMICTLHDSVIRDIINVVQCMEAICEYIRVDLVAATLTLQSSDHSKAMRRRFSSRSFCDSTS